MTDNMNMPMEPTRKMVNAGASACEYEISRAKVKAVYRAMLATAPKADHFADVGNMAEAPKVKQEPAAMILKAPCQHCHRMTIVPNETLALYHPAPASDELLEALESKLNEYAFRVSDYVVEEALELIAQHKGPQS